MMRKTWLLVSFAHITSSMLTDNNIPKFCSRIFGDTWKILTVLWAGAEAMYQAHVPKFHSLCSLLFLSQWLFLFLQRRGNLEDLLLKHFTEQPLSSSWRVLNSWKIDLTLPGYHTHTLCLTQALRGVHDPEQSSGRHAGVNHWNEPGHAIVCQIFSLSKLKSALSQTRKWESLSLARGTSFTIMYLQN